MKFNKDEQKNERLMLAEKLTRKMRDNAITYDGNLFHNIIYVLTESQQWQDVAELMREQITPESCQPNMKTMKYIRSNLVYCF